VRLDRADAEVGADGSDPVGFGQAGARGPAVGELRLLVGQRELLALVLLGLDPADLVGGRLVADQQHDRAQPVGRQPLAGARGQQSALAGVEGHPRGVVRGAVADAGHQLAHGHQHAGEPLDALRGDLAAGIGRQLEVVERDAGEHARRLGGRARGDVKQGGRRRGRHFGVWHG
jgi:hypothetical protein